jgi:hypothetical protein
MRAVIDHILMGAAELNQAIEIIIKVTGCKPVYGGQHQDGATHNALLQIGSDAYLELIAPVSGRSTDNRWSAICDTLTAPAIIGYCMRTETALADVAARLGQAGIPHDGPLSGQRQSPDSTEYIWQLIYPDKWPGSAQPPFLIHWLSPARPESNLPRTDIHFHLNCSASYAEGVHRWCTATGMALPTVEEQPEALSLTLRVAGREVRI